MQKGELDRMFPPIPKKKYTKEELAKIRGDIEKDNFKFNDLDSSRIHI